MKNLYTFLLVFTTIFFGINCVSAQTNVPGGNVSGTWTLSGSPYLINGSIQIPNGQTLTIEPGVTLNFQGSYKLYIQGRILAIGTVSDTITFTAQDTTTGWKGIRFDNTPETNDTSKLIYCKIQLGKASGINEDAKGGALYFNNFSKTIVANCRIHKNSANSECGGIYCYYSSPTIINNTISNNSASNSAGGISCNFSSPAIINNTIYNNSAPASGGGIFCYNYSSPTIINNTIYNNLANSYGGGIFCFNFSSPTITSNTISNNLASFGGGIYCSNSSNPTIKNTILWGNTANISEQQLFLNDENSDPDFYSCDVQGGTSAFGLNGNFYTGTYQNNLDSDPLFVAPTAGSGNTYDGTTADWSLQVGSPCINAGTTDTTGLNLPSTDIAGNPRVSNGRIDIGAYEHLGTSINNPITNNLINIYPNPNNGKFLLYIENYESKNYALEIYDITGQIIYSKIYENKTFLAENIVLSEVENGVYLVKITDGENVFRKHIIIYK